MEEHRLLIVEQKPYGLIILFRPCFKLINRKVSPSILNLLLTQGKLCISLTKNTLGSRKDVGSWNDMESCGRVRVIRIEEKETIIKMVWRGTQKEGKW